MAQPLNAARLFNHTIEQASDANVRAGRPQHQPIAGIHRTDAGGPVGTSLDWMPVHRRSAGGRSSLRPVLEELAAESSAIAQERGLQMRLRSTDALVLTDALLLRRIIRNLLTNALRYTQRGGVLLGCRPRADHVLIEVYDTGPGIPEDKRQEIFEEFKRLNPGQADGERGLGLGLAISERMASLLGHELRMDSNPGRGSVFRLKVQRSLQREQTQRAAPAVTPSADLGLEGARILCVDNDAHTLAATRALLERWGCVVATAHDAAEALRVSPTPPDALLVDYHLDEGTGIDAYRQLCTHWSHSPPTVLVTGRPVDGSARGGQRSRASLPHQAGQACRAARPAQPDVAAAFPSTRG